MATQVLYATTPPDYFKISSPTLRIPVDTSISIPVGLLACQRDPLLREIRTNVVNCTVSQPPPPPKKAKKGSVTVASVPVLEVILHDTVIFPEGGGQPSDIGHIIAANGEMYDVTQVNRVGGHAIHYVRAKDAEKDLLAFPVGAAVTVNLGQDGFDRRYDHMSMHTSQHLLSALLDRINVPTLSWSLTASPAPCYVELPRSLSAEEIASVQAEANQLVFEGRKIHVEVKELDKAVIPDVPKLESGREVGRGLPSDYTGGVHRVIVIDGVDRNPCCGTHLPSLHNLQLFLLPHTETVSRSATTSARLYFLAGPRLISHLTLSHTLLAGAASTLSCGAPQVPERVNQVIDERKRAEKRNEDLETELAPRIAGDILGALEEDKSEGLFVSLKHRTDDAGNALAFLTAVSSSFINLLSASPSKSRPYLIVLSSSPSSQNSTSTHVVLIFGSNETAVKAAGEEIKAKLGVKGGGKGSRWSGKLIGLWKEGKNEAILQEVIEGLKKN
ncbi:hypothetical protein HWV62_29809 [Athelia sp. TMB]|nr:hypothetical protein HWV62_29809 [Athelia sp. TMB]